MKYWRGYLVAAILAAITWALIQFAQAHSVLIDMVYPYMTRLVVTSMANWTGGMEFCLWQVLLIGMIVAGVVTLILMIILKWNFFQWFGWVCAAVSCVVLLHTGIYGLNQYASPLADDMRLEISDFTVSELNEATVYFRDKANELAKKVNRDSKGNADLGSFEELAEKAGKGFEVLTWTPISPLRRLRRGYDQVELLAQAVALELGTEAIPTLSKIRHNPPQSGITGQAQRRANVLGVYRPVEPERFRGKRVLLLDDIITSGATASEAARVLLTAGAKEVIFAAVAAASNEQKKSQ